MKAVMLLFAVPSLALATKWTLPKEQSFVAHELRVLAKQPGSPIYGVKVSSIKPAHIQIRGSLNGPQGKETGPSISFTALDLQKTIPNRGGGKATAILKASGKYLSNSVFGPHFYLLKVQPVQMP